MRRSSAIRASARAIPLSNREEGEGWLADACWLPLDTVRQVLAFHDQHEGRLAAVV